MPMRREERKGAWCTECCEAVDSDGVTLSNCPVNPPDECDLCGACFCDGSC